MNLEQIMDEWSKDCIVDPEDLAGESIRATNLHSKYMKLMMENRLKARAMDRKFKEMKLWKTRYYRGELNNKDDLDKYGIGEPFSQIILNNDIQNWLDGDSELNDILMKKIFHEEIAEYCSLIIKELNSRSYKLGNAIKWRIFIGGGG